MKTIYNVKLHEEIKEGNSYILRVAGGWIYTDTRADEARGIFVPFNNEFM